MTAQEPPRTRAASAQQLSWLRTQLADWTAAEVITEVQAQQLSARYHQARDTSARFTVGRVLLALGGGFVGIGIIWLVAANLDQLSPLTRFLAVAALWLGFLVTGESLAARSVSAPVVGAFRLMAALGFGAMIFQAAQSLHVPAYEPRLIGMWAAGALLHGYLTRGFLPFLVGILMGLGWWLWQPLWDQPSGFAAVILLGLDSVLAASMAVLHDGRLDRFAWMWRLVGGGLALAAMFAAAIPGLGSTDLGRSPWLILIFALSVTALIAALATRPGRRSLEAVGALAVLGVATLLAMWQPEIDFNDLATADWLRAAVSVTLYVVLAVGLMTFGTMRRNGALTWIATAALVVFTTFQSFAVFATIVTGAWLFVVLGTVFLGTGFLVDRARRELSHALDNDIQGATR